DLGTRKTRWETPGVGSVTYNMWHDGGVQSLVFAPDGRRLAVGQDNRISLLDPASGQEILKREGHPSAIRQLFFSPDGRRLITTSDDPVRRVLEWDTTSGRPIRTVPGKVLWARLTALSPDSRVLVSTGSPGLLLWDTATGGELRQIALPLKRTWE